MRRYATNLVRQLPAALLFAGLLLLALVIFLGQFAPKHHEAEPRPFLAYDRSHMQRSMDVESVTADFGRILAFGSRFTGDPGMYRTEEYLRREFEAAGLEILEQELDTALPRTVLAEVRSAEGTRLPIPIYPLMPNFVQPMTTAPDGIQGELVLLNEEVLRTRPSFEGCIGLLDNSVTAPEGYGYDWVKYAQLGMRALVVAHPQGLGAMTWDSLETMVSSNPANFVRLVAGPEIFSHVGQSLDLRVLVRFERVTTRNLIGRLQAGKPAREALVLVSAYDAGSMLPDLSPGTVEAVPVATLLALLRGIAPYREQLHRDVIFVALGSRVMANDGLNSLIRVLGTAMDRPSRKRVLLADQRVNDAALARVERILAHFDTPTFLQEAAATQRALRELTPADRGFLDDQCRYVLNTLVFEYAETTLRAKIDFERGGEDVQSAEYARYQEVKLEYDRTFSSSGYAPVKLLEVKPDFFQEYELRTRFANRFRELLDFHRTQQERLEQALSLHDLFADYRSLGIISPQLAPGTEAVLPEKMTFTMGEEIRHGDQALAMRTLLSLAIQQLDLEDRVQIDFTGPDHGKAVKTMVRGVPVGADMWCDHSYPAYTVVNPLGLYQAYGMPTELPHSRNLDTISHSLQVLGEAVLTAAFGNVRFEPLRQATRPGNFYGQVLASNVGESVIPNYPVRDALLSCKATELEPNCARRGYFPYLYFFSDLYGKYDYRHCTAKFIPAGPWTYAPEATLFDQDGRIVYVKDEGLAAQSLYRSMQLGPNDMRTPITVVTYRATPVTVLDLTNPQTFSPYSTVEFIGSKTLSPFSSTNTFHIDGVLTGFVSPEERFFAVYKAGAEGNELVQATRGFALSTSDEQVSAALLGELGVRLGRELDAEGYLALDTPALLGPAREIAKSMVFVNAARLAVAERYGMADERTLSFHEKSAELLEAALDHDQALHQARLLARDSATYATLNHPVIRRTIAEAVIGILWYLGLLVPFVFFFEKLLFAHTDIRKQILAQLVIFLVVFALLRTLHPAFIMIRSSLMILLGFITFLFSAGITLLFAGKFQENLESIRKQRGQVTAAEVNRMGVVGTAFMLGLNNMHRRRVRTGFTCATLVLLTFAMICFTSVRSDLVDTTTAMGKAPFQGFVVKNEKFAPVKDAELFALQTKYGERYKVVPRITYVGVQEWPSNERRNPKLEMVHAGAAGGARSVSFDSMLRLSAFEPMAAQVELLTGRGWFTPEQDTAPTGPLPVILPDALATRLGITPDMVDEVDVLVRLNGEQCLVWGIFDSGRLNELRDMDGRMLLPFDVEALAVVNRVDQNIIAEDSDPRIGAERILLAPLRNLSFPIEDSTELIASVAVVLPSETPYREARAVVDEYLEQSGKATYYGLDDYAFLGRRARKSSLVGSIDLLIPLVIAALTVLNTMKGSVYERRDEIFVYNAVGIAPRHIFFMFFAEAFVYAVVGSVLGYILSQGVGKGLTALDYTGGLNMTFASTTTIYASLAIAVSVFLSTFYPARSAMEIAAPAEESGWTLPEPEENRLSFVLPFTFDYRDRIAILSFFNRYFLDHGEGSSGPFFAGRPRFGVTEAAAGQDNGYVPQLTVTIWLKPFDLGVSQDLVISLPRDPETGECIATLELVRLSGSLEGWKRTNHHFVTLLRRHFLYWRAVTEEERATMFEEAQDLLRSALQPTEV